MNEQTRVVLVGKSYPIGHKYGLSQVKTDGGLRKTRFNESRDCTIRALALSSGIKYEVAHKIGKDAGRKKRCGFYPEKLLEEAKKSNINFFKIIDEYGDGVRTFQPTTIKEFVKNHPSGRFYCRRRGHAFAVVDGVILDNTRNTPRQIIADAWKFIPNAENNACQPASNIVG